MASFQTNILIVGGGPAGLAAALAASSKKDTGVTLIDQNPLLGGQIWRAELGKTKSPEAIKLIAAVESGKINIFNNAQVFVPLRNNLVRAETPSGTLELEYEKLILATGARERFLPFPGWTLTGVFGAGGLQALVKGGLNVKNKRIVVAGTGPLLLVVAEYLKSKGANVVAIAEQTSAAKLNKFALGLWHHPLKIIQGVALKAKLLGIPYLTDCWITAANCRSPNAVRALSDLTEATALHTVSLFRKGRSWSLDCDYLACGFHLIPTTELASIIGCKIDNGFVAVNEFQQTSVENVLCAGEPTSIGGVEASLIEGRIAGLAATGETAKARGLFRQRDRSRRFADSLNRTFTLRDELKTLASDDTVVCRCEDVEKGQLTKFDNWREAKLQTRCGMGPCQGRVCGPAAEFLFDWRPDSVRSPIFPVKLENL